MRIPMFFWCWLLRKLLFLWFELLPKNMWLRRAPKKCSNRQLLSSNLPSEASSWRFWGAHGRQFWAPGGAKFGQVGHSAALGSFWYPLRVQKGTPEASQVSKIDLFGASGLQNFIENLDMPKSRVGFLLLSIRHWRLQKKEKVVHDGSDTHSSRAGTAIQPRRKERSSAQ